MVAETHRDPRASVVIEQVEVHPEHNLPGDGSIELPNVHYSR
jgi:hypothetical protein